MIRLNPLPSRPTGSIWHKLRAFMKDLLAVLPMAFVMVAGPQIVTAIVLATGVGVRRDSVYSHLGATAATRASSRADTLIRIR